MKVIQFDSFGTENLKTGNAPTPVIGDNGVLVNVKAAALQFLDLIMIEGKIMPDLALPHVPVSEGAGIVEAIGSRVTRWKKGDRVLIPLIQRWEAGKISTRANEIRTGMQTSGTLSEFLAIPENTLVRTPQNLSDEEAATLSVTGLTAWTHLAENAKVTAGQNILIQGTGGVSLFALQIAKILGLKIIATTSSTEKESKLKDLGADEVLNYKEVTDWGSAAKRITGGVDITLDVGGAENIEQSIAACRENAYIGLVGFMSGSEIKFDVLSVIMNYIRLQGYSVGSAQNLEKFAAAIEQNDMKPIIDSTFDFDDAREAFQRLKSGQAFGKIVVRI